MRDSFVALTRAVLGAIVLMLALKPAVAALPPTLNGALEFSQIYRPDVWQPVHLELRNETDAAIDGAAVLPLPDESAPALMKLPVIVPPHALVRVSVWGYFPRIEISSKKKQITDTTSLTTAEWRSADGALLSRTPIVGLPLSGKPGEGGEQLGETILLISEGGELPDEEHDVEALATTLAQHVGNPISAPAIMLESLSRDPQALQSMHAVVLDRIDPDHVDLARREVLLNYVRGGGTLVLAAPLASGTNAENWMASLMPVRQIGTRQADTIDVSANAPPLKLRRRQTIIEAIEGEGQVVLRGRDYVHAAIRSVGLGKVVFTSFPINALDESQPQATALWEQLLGVREHAWAWNAVELGATRRDVLGSMIGRKVAPWGVAAGLAGGYLLVILAVQLAFRGASRPRAFAWSGAVAVLLTCVLLVMGMTRRHEQSLLAARLTVMDVAPDGGGWQHESVTFIGADDPGMPLRTTDEQATIRPALADVRNPPEIRQAPMTVNKAGVLVDRIDRVWEASGPVGSHVRLKATARFNADGMSLHVDNGLGQPLRAPVLVSQLRALAMADLPVGQTLVKTMQPNAHDDFSNTLVLTSELSKRRGQVVLAALTPSAVQEMIELPAGPPMLIGFIDDAAGAGLIRVADDRAIETRVMTMVRTTVAMEPPAARTKITVPAPLVSIAFGKMPYDRLKEATEPSQQDGQWLIGFAVPRELGRLRPTRAKLQLRADVPGHRVTIRKEQCVTGIATVNEAPDPIATWERSTGLRDVSIDLSDHDIDREGRVWLLLDVHSTTATASASPLAWQIKDVAMSLEGEIIAPPTLVALPPTTNSVAGYTAEGYVRFQPREVRHMTDSEKQRLKDELAASLSKARPSSRAAQPQSTTATSN